MPKLICVFAGRILILMVLSCHGSICFRVLRDVFLSSITDMNMMTIDINTSGPAYSYNQSTINTVQLLAEINAREVIALYPVIFFYATILIIGIIGNTLVLLVYSHRYKRSPARLYILFLAAIDFSICLFGLPYHLIDLTHPYTFTNSTLCKSLTFIVTTLFHMSIFGLIVIAVDRYLKICRPLHKLKISYLGRRRACVVAIICAVALSWPQIVLYGPSEMDTRVDNITGYACFIETHFFETSYPFIYNMSTTIVCVGSTIFLILAYSLICRQICIRYKNDIIQIKTSANDLEELSQTDDVSLKSYTPSVIGKHTIGTSPLARSVESVHQKSSTKLHENDSEHSKINIYVNPNEQFGVTNDKEIVVSNENQSTTNQESCEATERCKLLPDDEPSKSDNHLCVTKQRSFSLDSFEFKTPLKPEDTYVHFNNQDTYYSKLKTNPVHNGTEKETTIMERRELKSDTDIRNSYSSQSSKNSSTHELFPKGKLRHYSDVGKINSSRINRLELPKNRLGDLLLNGDAFKRRYSENIGNRITIRSHRSRSMAIGGLISSTHFGEGLRIHTCNTRSNSIANSSSNSAKPPKPLSRKHSKITKIMLTITSIFILSYAPALVITIYSSICPDIWDTMTEFQTVISEFFLRFYLVNNICNPFIYGFWDKRFKREIVITLKKIFGFKGPCGKCYERISFDSIWKTNV